MLDLDNIKMSKETLLHTYQKHNIRRRDINKSLATGVRSILNGTSNNKVVYTQDYMAIVIDESNNLISAYKSNERQYRIRYHKSKINGKKLDPLQFQLIK